MVTMKEIARLAGISQQAVSAALNRNSSSKVSARTRERVLTIAEQLNYVGNFSAGQLRGKSIRAIGIVLSRFPHQNYFPMLTAAICRLEEANYQCYVVRQEDGGETRSSIRVLIARGVDGLLLLDCFCNEDIGSHRIPVLRVGSIAESPDLNIDKFLGGKMAAEHLIHQHGHRKIAFLNTCVNRSSDEKIAGIRCALKENGCGEEAFVEIVAEDNNALAAELLAAVTRKEFHAFICPNDYLAGGLIRFLMQNGIRVPEEVAVIGFDGSRFDLCMAPSLTTVVQPFEELGRRAAERLLTQLKNPEAGAGKSCEILQPRLWIGESCGCPCPVYPQELLFGKRECLTLERLDGMN